MQSGNRECEGDVFQVEFPDDVEGVLVTVLVPVGTAWGPGKVRITPINKD